MSKKLLLTFVLLSFLAVGSYQTFTDTSPANSDNLDKEISHLQAQLNALHKTQQNMKPLGLGASELGAAAFECTNGVNPATLSFKQYLDAFAAGPCSPVLVMAGIAETKLIIQIDCERLKNDRPDIFSGCGWDTCSNGWFSKSPRPEYNIWIPDIVSPFTLLDPISDYYQKCFSSVMGLIHEESSGVLRSNPPSGITIVPLGLTESTKLNSNCGFDAITNILPVNQWFSPAKWKAYEGLRIKLEGMGYKVGLTLQALPYDWRLSITDNQVSQKFVSIITRLYSISGKKVNIIAHSFGNVNTLFNLWKMSQAQKDRLISKYFALAPPWLGAPTTAAMMLGGSSSYHFKGLGLNFDAFKKTLGTYPGVFDLMPRNAWPLYNDTKWLRSIKNRINVEKGECDFKFLEPEDDIVNQIFPQKTETCYTNDWTARKKDCTSGLSEFFILGKVNGTEMTTANLKEIFTKFSFNEQAGRLFEISHSEEYNKLVNPGVNVVVVYSNILTTGNDFVYNDDPKPRSTVQGSNFIEPDNVFMDYGDTSVLTTSSLIPGIKWAYEFRKKEVQGAKPVVFVEMCSTQNRKTKVYQTEKQEILENEYQGVNCGCQTLGSEGYCDHLGMLMDPSIIDYLANSVQDKEKPLEHGLFEFASEETIANFVQNCEMLIY